MRGAVASLPPNQPETFFNILLLGISSHGKSVKFNFKEVIGCALISSLGTS